ncbi:MAG: tetratricopeptide repeat protein [Limisphaerales bacterium]
MRRIPPWLPLPALVLICALLQAADTNAPKPEASAFEVGNRLFDQGRFQDAARTYENLWRTQGVSPAVLYNLGNAWFRTNQLGRAIVHYRLAERMAPRDPDIRANLQFARQAVRGSKADREAAPPSLFSRLTLNEWTVLATVSGWIWMGLLIANQVKPAWRPWLKRAIWGAAATMLLLLLCLAFAWQTWARWSWAIVVVESTALRHGPLDESPGIRTLYDGQELRVLDRKNGWLQVSESGSDLGWVRGDQVLVLAP